MARMVLGIIGLVGTGNLLGQLSVDAVFDVSDAVEDQVFKSYFCALLDSMNGPAVARVLLPVGAIAACVATNALAPGRSVGDIIAAGVPGTVGLFVFAQSVSAVSAMCAGEITAGDGRGRVARLHVGVAFIMATCLAGQLFGLRSALLQQLAVAAPSQKASSSRSR